ncbi:MAG TPA: DUF3592 domain-containing protein [Micromonospora sp.]|nr:DUF3592 domain-containing protein [Micromonospora sp.]
MTPVYSDRLVKVLLVAIAMSGMLFLVAASSVVGTVRFRNGAYEDGRVIEARALKVVRGRGGEAQVEYAVGGHRYREWVYCGTSCPKEGELFEVEYSAKDPRQVVRNRAGPFSRTALFGLFVTTFAISLFVILFQRELRKLMRAANSARNRASREL